MLAYSHIALRINKLQNEIKRRFALNWTEYLVLCAIANLSETNKQVTPIDIHNELGLSKRATYKSLDRLVDKRLVKIGLDVSFWNTGGVKLSYGGELVLRAAERLMGNSIGFDTNKTMVNPGQIN